MKKRRKRQTLLGSERKMVHRALHLYVFCKFNAAIFLDLVYFRIQYSIRAERLSCNSTLVGILQICLPCRMCKI